MKYVCSFLFLSCISTKTWLWNVTWLNSRKYLLVLVPSSVDPFLYFSFHSFFFRILHMFFPPLVSNLHADDCQITKVMIVTGFILEGWSCAFCERRTALLCVHSQSLTIWVSLSSLSPVIVSPTANDRHRHIFLYFQVAD